MKQSLAALIVSFLANTTSFAHGPSYDYCVESYRDWKVSKEEYSCSYQIKGENGAEPVLVDYRIMSYSFAEKARSDVYYHRPCDHFSWRDAEYYDEWSTFDRVYELGVYSEKDFTELSGKNWDLQHPMSFWSVHLSGGFYQYWRAQSKADAVEDIRWRWKELLKTAPAYSEERVPADFKPYGAVGVYAQRRFSIGFTYSAKPVETTFWIMPDDRLTFLREQERLDKINAGHLRPRMKLTVNRIDPATKSSLRFIDPQGDPVGEPLPVYCVPADVNRVVRTDYYE